MYIAVFSVLVKALPQVLYGKYSTKKSGAECYICLETTLLSPIFSYNMSEAVL